MQKYITIDSITLSVGSGGTLVTITFADINMMIAIAVGLSTLVYLWVMICVKMGWIITKEKSEDEKHIKKNLRKKD